jgi:transposase InsO family protein
MVLMVGPPQNIQDVSCKGNCRDNAVSGSFFHMLKTERVHYQRYQTRVEAKRDIFEYFANNHLSPVDYEMQLKSA